MKKDLTKFAKTHKDQLILNMDIVYILIGLAEDDNDIYWRLKDIKGKEMWESCVGSVIPLKGILKDKDYKRLMYWFEVNNLTKNMSKAEISEYNKIENGKVLV